MKKSIKINKGTQQEKIIGIIDTKDKTFTKEVYLSRCLFKALDAWGIDAEYFTDVLCPNNYLIRIIDRENNREYLADAETIKKYGTYYHFKSGKSDNKSQIFLPRNRWEIPKPLSAVEKLKRLSQLGVFG